MVGMFPRAWEGASTARGSRTTPSVRRTRRSAHGARATSTRLPGAFAHRAVARGASRAPTSPRRAWRPAGALPVGCVVIKVQRDLFVVQSERVSSAPTGCALSGEGVRCESQECTARPGDVAGGGTISCRSLPPPFLPFIFLSAAMFPRCVAMLTSPKPSPQALPVRMLLLSPVVNCVTVSIVSSPENSPVSGQPQHGAAARSIVQCDKTMNSPRSPSSGQGPLARPAA